MYAEDTRNFSHGFGALKLAREGQLLVGQCRGPAKLHATRFRCIPACPGALNDQRPLELSDPRENGHHHPARRRCRVSPGLGQAFQSSARFLDTLSHIEEIPCAASQPIKAGDHHQVTSAEVIEQAFQLRPLPASA